MFCNGFYYYIKPFVPRKLQIFLRRQVILRKRPLCKDIWPIHQKAGKAPDNWAGWPDQKKFALVLTHDVDTSIGQEKCRDLMKLEKDLGFRSSFNFVPERYEVFSELREELVKNGFEVGVHGLNHDGKLYHSKEIFQRRAKRINMYLEEWQSVGFRSPCMHHNLNWIHELDIEYDASTFDTDPFEPQSDGAGSIFPFWVTGDSCEKRYLELPYTLPQDFTLFILFREKDIGIWKLKLDWIVKHGGMALVNTHPDYMAFDGKRSSFQEYPSEYYLEFLEYIKEQHNGKYWHALPRETASFWSSIFLACSY